MVLPEQAANSSILWPPVAQGAWQSHMFLGRISPQGWAGSTPSLPGPLASPGMWRQGSHPSSLQEVGSQD